MKIKEFKCNDCKNKFPIYKRKWFHKLELCELCNNRRKKRQKSKRNLELKK